MRVRRFPDKWVLVMRNRLAAAKRVDTRSVQKRASVVLASSATLLSLLLPGCGGVRPLAVEELSRIRKAPAITAVVYQPPPSFRQRGSFDEN